MTAVAFQHAVGSRWIVNVILAAALLSLFKCFNGNFVAASRLFFALGRRGMVDPACRRDPRNVSDSVVRGSRVSESQLPSVCCLAMRSSFRSPKSALSLAPSDGPRLAPHALRWPARRPDILRFSLPQRGVAVFGLSSLLRMALMKLVPNVPGHFTVMNGWRCRVWITLGAVMA